MGVYVKTTRYTRYKPRNTSKTGEFSVTRMKNQNALQGKVVLLEFCWNEYLKSVKTLENNRKNVPLQELETKYAKPYSSLLKKIKRNTEVVISDLIFSTLLFESDEDKEKVCEVIFTILDGKKDVLAEISSVLYSEFDIRKALEILYNKMLLQIWEEAYIPYWDQHCSLQEKDTVIWNDLLQMKWNRGLNMWESLDGSAVTIMFPPSAGLLERMKDE